MRHYLLILLLVVSITTILPGQKPKFKKVTKAELEKTVCEYDSTANAEYLYHGCSVKFEYNKAKGKFEVINYFHDRIKIYNEDGFGLADQILSCYVADNVADSEKISGIEAYTFNLENGKVVKEKLKKNNVFTEKMSDNYEAKKFAMPAVKAGSVLEIKYTLTTPYYFRMDEFYFQKEIPVKYTEYEVRTPEYYNYNYNVKGLVNLEVEEGQTQGKINYSNTARNNRATNTRSVTTFETHTYLENLKKYSASNVKAIQQEPFVYSMDNFKGSIRMELLFTKFPSSGIDYYTKTWDDIAELLHNNDSFGKQLRKNYKGIEPLLEEVKNMEGGEKVATIYSTIRDQYTWNGEVSRYTDKGIKNLLKEGTGNCAEINLLLVNALQKSGINAYPMVYRTRKSGYLNNSNPSISDLNYVVALIIEGDKVIYLDATDKNLSIDMLPTRALNLKGVVVMDKKGQEVPIENHNKGSESRVYTLKYDGENLAGTYKQISKGYDAYYDRSNYKTVEDYVKHLQKDDVIYSNTEVKEFENCNKPISVVSDILIKGNTQEFDDKIFIDLMVGSEEFKNPFESKERDFSLFFNSKSNSTKLIKIEVPEGYQVESIPKTLNVATPEMYITHLIKTQVVGKEIVITIRNKINNSIISPVYYESVKLLFDNIETTSKEKIVLAKIE